MPLPEGVEQRIVLRSPRLITMFAALVVAIVAMDLAMKHYSFRHVAGQPVTRVHIEKNVMPPHDAVTVVPRVLSLKLTINHGAVFGLGAGGRFFFIAVTVVAVIAITAIFLRSERTHRALHIGLAMVMAGALGNLYDRALYGAVRDMLYLFPGVKLPFGITWPGGNDELYPWIFNIADVALCIGVILILFSMMRTPSKTDVATG